MPTAPPFLPHRGILRTPDRRHRVIAGHTDVAANAFTNVGVHAQFDLPRQERISDGRPRRTNEIHNARTDLIDHHVGTGEATDTDHRLARQLLQAAQVLGVRPFRTESRRRGVVGPIPDHEVPQIG